MRSLIAGRKESLKNVAEPSGRRRVTESGLEIRLQGRPSVGGRLFGIMDEQPRLAKANVIKNNKEVIETAIIAIEKVAHR